MDFSKLRPCDVTEAAETLGATRRILYSEAAIRPGRKTAEEVVGEPRPLAMTRPRMQELERHG
jgi:hypothetical protein